MQTVARRIIALPFALLLCTCAPAQFTDDFTDGDLSSSPAWSGNDAFFLVDNGQLRSNTGTLSSSTVYYLSTASGVAADAQWEFFVNLKFATSGANYVDVYLMSDGQDLSTPGNGYFVRIGETSDHVALYKMTAGVPGLLVASPDGIVNSSTDNPFRIKVTRDAADLWTLYYDDGAMGTYLIAGTITEASFTSSAWFGVCITQSTAASAVNNHFFDDFYAGPIILDTSPPTVVSVTATGADEVDVLWSEPLSPTAIGNYDILPSIGVSSAIQDALIPALVHLTPTASISANVPYTVFISMAEDLAGNVAPDNNAGFTWTVLVPAQPGDVVMNELMPDPDPPVGLPNAEFVELLNTTTDQTFDLAGWTITDGSSSGTLPAVVLPPGGFVILASTANAPLFSGFGSAIGVPAFPSLNNDGDPLELQDANGTVIDGVAYSSAWYNDPTKAEGGWTLERKDPLTPCSGPGNWAASTNGAGGTPGAPNSVFAILNDTMPPSLQQVFVVDSVTVDLLFTEAMDQASLLAGTYAIDPAVTIANAAVIALDRVRLHLAEELAAGALHTVTVTGVTDCPGNAIGAANSAIFALPEPLVPGDVVINEVLYDPFASGSDFVELYNRSQKVLSLAGLQLANGSGSNALITADAWLLLPGEYVAIASDTANVLMNYPLGQAERLLQAALPSFNNGEGSVILLDAGSDTLDRFDYSDDLQFPLLQSVDGVSLERVDPGRPTDDNSNWHSAAADVDFATPGYRNSQFAPAPAPRGSLDVPAIFSPDNDGYQDLLTITYAFDEPGFVASMIVFDLAGREVKTLMNNVLLGSSGAISWDGMMNTNELARMGPYVIYMEAYDLNGNVEKFRKTVVLAHRL
jgi:hypothetical protein